jgi:hypothetical protein
MAAGDDAYPRVRGHAAELRVRDALPAAPPMAPAARSFARDDVATVEAGFCQR